MKLTIEIEAEEILSRRELNNLLSDANAKIHFFIGRAEGDEMFEDRIRGIIKYSLFVSIE